MLNSSSQDTHLNKSSLHHRTISERCYTYVDTALVDDRRTPDEIVWRSPQPSIPDYFSIGGIQGIEMGIPTAYKGYWSRYSANSHGSNCGRTCHTLSTTTAK